MFVGTSIFGCEPIDRKNSIHTISREIFSKVERERSVDWAIISSFTKSGFERETASYPMRFTKEIKKDNITSIYKVVVLSPVTTEDRIYVHIVYSLLLRARGFASSRVADDSTDQYFYLEKSINEILDLIGKEIKDDSK